MIITIDVFLKLCAGISCVGLALSYLIKLKVNPRRKLLVIWGARQVGKTYLIKEMFAKEF